MVGDTAFHLEAIAVEFQVIGEVRMQVAAHDDFQGSLDALGVYGGDGAFQTVELGEFPGRAYVLVMTPYAE